MGLDGESPVLSKGHIIAQCLAQNRAQQDLLVSQEGVKCFAYLGKIDLLELTQVDCDCSIGGVHDYPVSSGIQTANQTFSGGAVKVMRARM